MYKEPSLRSGSNKNAFNADTFSSANIKLNPNKLSYILDPPSLISLAYNDIINLFEGQIIIKNTNKDFWLAFRIKTSAPEIYFVKPKVGCLAEGQVETVKIVMKAEDAHEKRFDDKFLIQLLSVEKEAQLPDSSSIIKTFDEVSTEDRNERMKNERLRISMKYPDIEKAKKHVQLVQQAAAMTNHQAQTNTDPFTLHNIPATMNDIDWKSFLNRGSLSKLNQKEVPRILLPEHIMNSASPERNFKPNSMQSLDLQAKSRHSYPNFLAATHNPINAGKRAVTGAVGLFRQPALPENPEDDDDSDKEDNSYGKRRRGKRASNDEEDDNFIEKEALSREKTEKSYEEKVYGLIEKSKNQELEIKKITEERNKYLNELNKLKFTLELDKSDVETDSSTSKNISLLPHI